MTIVLIAFSIGVAFLAAGTHLIIPAIALAIASFWGNGVLHNFRGMDPDLAPDWAAVVSFLSFTGSLLVGIAALFMR